ncbi:MAG: SDR family oxidoreductase [Propionibacterium sp.]|nr:SDR family oxidoreductase [Propionibacterium sp.]
MRIVVIGGNGGTGACLAHLGLARGDEIVSVSRRGWANAPAGLTDVRLDATDSALLDEVLTGADAVVIAVGAPGFGKQKLRTAVTASVVAAMQRVGVRRLVVHSSLGVGESLKLMKQPIRTFAKLVLGRALADHADQEAVAAASGLDWAVVQPGGLADDPATGDVRLVATGVARPGQPTGRISRADVAAGILQILDEGLTGRYVFAAR